MSKSVAESATFGIAYPDLPIQLLWGYTTMINGSLLFSVPIVMRFW